MNSSYLNKLNYGDVIKTVTFLLQPKMIMEIGILEGFSLSKFIDGSSEHCQIQAYDIFDKFNGNHANYEKIIEKFKDYENVFINNGDLYELYKKVEDNSIDILHIDIANNGDVLNFVIEHYITKLTKNGIIIFEGGSEERDNIEWMIKYNKPKIKPILDRLQDRFDILTIGTMPSISIIVSK